MDVGRLALGVGRLALGVGRLALGVGRWAFDVGRWTLDVGRWAFGVGLVAYGKCGETMGVVLFLLLSNYLPIAAFRRTDTSDSFHLFK